MILDNEGQRQNLLQVIRNVSVSGPMEEAIQVINMLKGLEHDVQTAELGPMPSQAEDPKTGKLSEV